MKYDALIFDMDGTLVHNMPTHIQAWQDTFAQVGVQIDKDEFNRSTTGKTNLEIMRLLLGPDVSQAEMISLGDRKEALYRERFADCREPLPGLVKLLELARSLGIPMAVATAAQPANIAFILDELNLRRYFQVVVGAHNVERGKPHPDIFLKSAELLGVAPENSLVFEDALGGIEAARRAGMTAVMICTTIAAQEVAGLAHVLDAVPDFTYLALEELLGV